MKQTEILLQGLRAGKIDSLEQAIRTYSPYVAAVVSYQLGDFRNQADVEELVSDVFFTLWQWRERL